MKTNAEVEKIFAEARDAALKFLGARQRTLRETEKRLEEKNYPAETISRVTDLMIKYGYVDDERYAEDYAKSRLASGNYGRHRVKRELIKKGVDANLIDAAIIAAARDFDEIENARSLLVRKRYVINEMETAEKKRASDMLARRGFSWAAIRAALECDDEG